MYTYYMDWYGPFTYQEIMANKLANEKISLHGNGLYLLTGKKKWQKSKACIQYIGLTINSFKKRLIHDPHPGIESTNSDLQIWLGQVCYDCKVTKNVLELTESILVFFSDPPLNKKKKKKPINKNCTVISRFFKQDGQKRMRQSRMLHDIPDVLSWDSDKKILYYSHRLSQIS